MRLRCERRRWCHFRDDLADAELHSDRRTSCRKRTSASDRLVRSAEPGKASLQDAAGRRRPPTFLSSEHLERESGRAHQVSDLVREEPEAFALASGLALVYSFIAAPELGHGTRDGVIQATVQGAEVLDADGRSSVSKAEVGDGLADVPIVVHDLRPR